MGKYSPKFVEEEFQKLIIVVWQSGQLRFSHKEVGKPIADSNSATTTKKHTASISVEEWYTQ